MIAYDNARISSGNVRLLGISFIVTENIERKLKRCQNWHQLTRAHKPSRGIVSHPSGGPSIRRCKGKCKQKIEKGAVRYTSEVLYPENQKHRWFSNPPAWKSLNENITFCFSACRVAQLRSSFRRTTCSRNF